MIPRRRFEEFFSTVRFALLGALPVWLLVVLLGSRLVPSGKGYDGTALGLLAGLIADSRSVGLLGSIPWALLFLGLALGIRDVRKGRGERATRKILRAAALAMLVCLAVESRGPDLGPLRTAFLLGGIGVLFALAIRGWTARRAASLLFLLLLLPSSCDYFLGDYEVTEEELAPDPEPEFLVLRILRGEGEADSGNDIFLYVARDGWFGRDPGPVEALPPGGAGASPIVSTLPPNLDDPRKQTCLMLVPEGTTPWEHIRRMIHAAIDPDIGIREIRLFGSHPGDGRVLSLRAQTPIRDSGDGSWTTWDDEPLKIRVTLTAAARNGVDTAALAARVEGGPVLLAAADGVPAQVVADAIAALHEAGAEPVVLSPDAPEPGGEETLPGVVLRRE